MREGRRQDHAPSLVSGLCQCDVVFPTQLANQTWIFFLTKTDVLAGATRSVNLAWARHQEKVFSGEGEERGEEGGEERKGGQELEGKF